MKNKLLKSFVIIALLISLVTTLVACDNNDGGKEETTTPDPGTLTTLKDDYKPLDSAIGADKINTSNALYKEFMDSFSSLNGKLSSKLVKTSGTVDFVASEKLDAEGAVAIPAKNKTATFELQSYADTNLEKTNTSKAYMHITVKDNLNASTLTTDIHMLFDASSSSFKIGVYNGTSPQFERNININDVSAIAKSLNKMGKPVLPTSIEALLAELDSSLGGTIKMVVGADSLVQLYNQQIIPLLNRMMFEKTDNGYNSIITKDATNKYSVKFDAKHINSVFTDFFTRGSKIANDTKYNPHADYVDKNGLPLSSKIDDAHNNNSDEFYKLFGDIIGLINNPKIIKNENNPLDTNINNWVLDIANGTGFGLSEDAFTFDASITPNSNGFTDGSANIIVKKGSKVYVPFVTKKDIEIKRDVEFKVSKLQVAVTDASDNSGVTAKTIPASLNDLAKTNLINLKNEKYGISVDAKNPNKLTYTLSLNDVNIDIFALLKIENNNAKNADYVKETFKALDIEIAKANKDVVFSIKWDTATSKLVVKPNGKPEVSLDCNQIAKIVINSKKIANDKVAGKSLMGLIGGFDFGKISEIKANVNIDFSIGQITLKTGLDTAILGVFKTSYPELLAGVFETKPTVDLITTIFGKDSGVTDIIIQLYS